jgi:8-oxo-dGTP diphosphatase
VRHYTNLESPERSASLAAALVPGELWPMSDPLPTDPRLIDRFSRVLIGAVVVVADAAGRLIFVRQPRGPFAGSWLLPGGGLEVDEDALTGARRETLEETGVDVKDLEFLATFEVLGNWEHGPFHFVLLAFAGHAPVDLAEHRPGENEGEMCWSQPGDLQIHPTVMMVLNQAGYTRFSPSEIEGRLHSVGLSMVRYG